MVVVQGAHRSQAWVRQLGGEPEISSDLRKHLRVYTLAFPFGTSLHHFLECNLLKLRFQALGGPRKAPRKATIHSHSLSPPGGCPLSSFALVKKCAEEELDPEVISVMTSCPHNSGWGQPQKDQQCPESRCLFFNLPQMETKLL